MSAASVVSSPLCLFDGGCPRQGRAALGAEEKGDGYVNREIRCLTCGRTGVESRNTEPRMPGRFLKLDVRAGRAPLTLTDRVDAFKAAFPAPADAWPYVSPSGRWIYGTWETGQQFRSATGFLGSYPPLYLPRVMALFPDVIDNVLHAFAGSLPPGPYVRLDLHHDAQRQPDVQGDVYDASRLFGLRRFDLVCADPPYMQRYAARYGVPMVVRARAMRALADVARPGGHLVWLDLVAPMFRKREWHAMGKIALHGSTNHMPRTVFIFERRAA